MDIIGTLTWQIRKLTDEKDGSSRAQLVAVTQTDVGTHEGVVFTSDPIPADQSFDAQTLVLGHLGAQLPETAVA